MSHTNHRSGSVESLKYDYPVLTMGARGYNRDGCLPKQLAIGEIFLEHNPVNAGCIGLEERLTKDVLGKAAEVLTDNTVTHAVFTSQKDLIECLKALKEANLGLSIVVSGLFEDVHACCRQVGLEPHTVNASLGVWGNVEEKMPKDPRVADVTTMCGHGMIPFPLVEDMVEKIKAGKLTPVQAAEKLMPQCNCHIFNPERAAHILEEIAAD